MKKLEADILKILEDDCRYTPAKIAVMLGRTEEEIEGAIRSMEERGVIVKYTAIVNGERLSDETVQALIEVRVTPQRDRGFDRIAERLYNYPEVYAVYLISGSYDLLVTMEGKTLKEVSRFVSEKLSPLDGVLSTATHFILKKYKDHGTVMVTKKESERIPVTL